MSFAANKLTPAMTSTNKLPFGQHQDQPENPPSTSSASSEAAATVVVGSLSPTSVMASSNNNAGVKPISCSPTSVTIVPTSAGSSSSASEVTKAATSSTGPNAANTSTPKKEQHRSNDKKASGPGTTTSSSPSMPKPFFLMDWLEEVNPKDLEIARQMLQTPNKKTNPRHQSTPNFGQTSSSPSDSSPSSSGIASARDTNNNKSRSAIALPSLAHGSDWNSHSEDDRSSVCRQLYPASPSGENKQQKQPSEKEEDKTSNIMRRSTSSTSHGSSAALANPPVRATPAVVKMSPFKRKSIAIGNGWNAKGLQKAKKGSWESALLCWQNALEIREQVLGDSHPDTANTLNNCGIAMGKLGRFDEAIEVLERALEIRAEHYGTRQHPEVAATLHNIGNVLHQAQDRAGAIQCFWDAKLLQEKILGPDHVQVARACVAIGNVYYEALQYDDAREAYHDALLVFTNAGLAADHAEVLAMQQDISDLDAIITAHPYHHAMHHHQSTHPMMMMAAYQHQHYQYHHHHHPYAQGVLEDIL